MRATFERIRTELISATPRDRADWILSSLHWFPALAATFKLQIFENLSKPRTFEELRSRLNDGQGVSANGLDCLLYFLVGIGLVVKNGEHLESMLPDADVEQLRIYFLACNTVMQRQLFYLDESVCSGNASGLHNVFGNKFPSLYHARRLEEVKDTWDPLMETITNGSKVMDIFCDEILRSKATKILDWCGSTGYNAIQIAKRCTGTDITVLDLDFVCQEAEREIEAHGLTERISTLPCDLLDPEFKIAEKYDFIAMVHAIREWSKVHLKRFFQLAVDALNPGGTIMINSVSRRTVGEYKNHALSDLEHFFPSLAYFICCASDEAEVHAVNDISALLKEVGAAEVFVNDMEGQQMYLIAKKTLHGY